MVEGIVGTGQCFQGNGCPAEEPTLVGRHCDRSTACRIDTGSELILGIIAGGVAGGGSRHGDGLALSPAIAPGVIGILNSGSPALGREGIECMILSHIPAVGLGSGNRCAVHLNLQTTGSALNGDIDSSAHYGKYSICCNGCR